jgi:hypothetical protein
MFLSMSSKITFAPAQYIEREVMTIVAVEDWSMDISLRDWKQFHPPLNAKEESPQGGSFLLPLLWSANLGGA